MTTQRQHSDSPEPFSPVDSSSDQAAPPLSQETEAIALQQELAALRAAHEQEMSALRAEMTAQITMLHAALAVSQPQPAVAASPQESLPLEPASSDGSLDEPGEPSHAHANRPTGTTGTTSRRTLLKWGGVGAAAALAAAGGAAITTPTAHASDGGNLILGSDQNMAEHLTQLTYDGTEPSPVAFAVFVSPDDSRGIISRVGNATDGGTAYGVYGSAGSGYGAFGVFGSALTDGTGVFGSASGSQGVGVYGATDSGFGVIANSQTGIDFWGFGTGRLAQALSGSVGAPTTGSYLIGEQIRDNNGDLFICVASGSPGTWRQVLTVNPGNSGVISLLAKPIRLLDTRTGLGTSGAGPWASGSTKSLQVTGVSIGGIQVPHGAIGVIGNVTVVRPNAAGDLRLYPGGTAAPSTSSINFANGQIIANGVIVGLSSGGQLSIKVDMPANTATNVLFDASGYIV